MGLDIYVGSFTRFYTGDWELIAQKVARELGLTIEVVRPPNVDDRVGDPEAVRLMVIEWRDGLSANLAGDLAVPLDWREDAQTPYFTDKPTWDCYSNLLLWAAYAEHPLLTRPSQSIEDFGVDPAYQLSTTADFESEYLQLLNTGCWLPCEFDFVFQSDRLGGESTQFGSSITLATQLDALNARTWGADKKTISAWRKDCSEYGAPLESGAKFAFAVLRELASESIENRLPMILDY
jgi:hypothetical protein